MAHTPVLWASSLPPPPPPPPIRCELSMEKSTVLQSELKSCKELQELEPENKCEALFHEILLLSGSPFCVCWGDREQEGSQ